ncbi:MAG: hypothetical protein Q9168_001076 [Polycauliona sp. 1 TL-2023]
MPNVQDELKSCHIPNSKRKAGPVLYAEDCLLQAPVKKPKYQQLKDGSSLWNPFTIKVRNHERRAFQPRLLLSRSRLPLAYLDTSGTAGHGRGTRFFSAQIPLLETHCQGNEADILPLVLITESTGDSLYAVERVQHGIYAQCRLADWIRLNHLQVLQVSDPHTLASSKQPHWGKADEWWLGIRKQQSPSFVHPNTAAYLKTRCDLRTPAYISTEPTSSQKGVALAAPLAPPAVVSKGGDDPLSQEPQPSLCEHGLQTPEDLLRSVETQYKDLLYRSKASLAYFAKGPLSRARAAFSDDTEAPTGRHCLVEHLRALILPVNVLDIKYREALPSLVEDLPNAGVSDNERHEVVKKYKKPIRKSKKQRVGKNGLYPEEEMDIVSWWLDYVASVPASDSLQLMAEATSAQILEQRCRETFLQIILVLEVLALESMKQNQSVDQGLIKELGEGDFPEKKRKRKKPQDLSLLLDLSVDRLCIWQSMVAEKDSSSEKIGDAERANTGQASFSQKQNNNRLPEFCVDIIHPFTPYFETIRINVTEAAEASLKREPSDIALSKIPAAKAKPHLSKRYSQREVDLTAVSQAKEAKAKKKAEVEQELQGAIAALKRPNPRMAVKELVESAERRATGTRSRKPKHPVRNAFAQSVQIMATPSANRRRDVYASRTSQMQQPAVISEDVEEIPPSSCLRVPASTTKLLPDLQAAINPAEPRRYPMPSVEQTPTRGPSKFSRLNTIPNARPSTAEQAAAAEPKISSPDGGQPHAYQLTSSRLDIQGTPSRRPSTARKGNLPCSGIESTPVKPLGMVSANSNSAASGNMMTSSAFPKGEGASIYQSLGWDDDVDDFM